MTKALCVTREESKTECVTHEKTSKISSSLGEFMKNKSLFTVVELSI